MKIALKLDTQADEVMGLLSPHRYVGSFTEEVIGIMVILTQTSRPMNTLLAKRLLQLLFCTAFGERRVGPIPWKDTEGKDTDDDLDDLAHLQWLLLRVERGRGGGDDNADSSADDVTYSE